MRSRIEAGQFWECMLEKSSDYCEENVSRNMNVKRDSGEDSERKEES